jgi:hypothetical protein
MVERDKLVGLDDMVRAAEEAGFGESLKLKRRFVEYQGHGLLGKPVARAARRGGEGLWHPNLLALFLDELRMREREKLRLPTIANLPIGLWRLGVEGVTTEQAQRAMSYWAGHLPGAPSGGGQPGRNRRSGVSKAEARPRGDRSLRRKSIDQAVAWLAAPGATEGAKRELRDLLEVINDTGEPASPDTWARASLGVIAPSGNPSIEQRTVAHNQSIGFSVQVLAIHHLDSLCAPTSSSLWEWARAVDQKNRPGYLAQQAKMIADPGLGHLYSRPLAFDILQQGCVGLLTILGIALAVLWGEYGMKVPPGEEPPPRLKIDRRK